MKMKFKNSLLQKQVSPEVSRWNRMVFRIQYPPKEHNPPHFHVSIGEGKTVSLNIWDLKPTSGEKGGTLSSSKVEQIQSWFETPTGNGKTVQALMYENWLLAQYHKPLVKIPTPQELKNQKPKTSSLPDSAGLYAIKNVVPVKPYALLVEFRSGERKLIDVYEMFKHHRMFNRLWDWNEFKKVRFTPDVVEWYRGLAELEIEDQDLWAAGIPCD